MISIVVPTLDEEKSVGEVVKALREEFSNAGIAHEILVVDDGSSDHSGEVAAAAGATVIRHEVRQGYGQSIRSGVLAARYPLIGLIDADGSYVPSELIGLMRMCTAFDMAVGARKGKHYHGSRLKFFFRNAIIRFCEFVTGTHIPDINSGIRVFRAVHVRTFSEQLSSGFSFTTSLTLSLLLNRFFVGYAPVTYRSREGKSKVKLVADGLRTLQIIFEMFARYNPLKLFLTLLCFTLTLNGAALLAYVLGVADGMSCLLFVLLVLGGSMLSALGFLSVPSIHRIDRTKLALGSSKDVGPTVGPLADV